MAVHVLFWWVDGLPGAAVVVCDQALELRVHRLAAVHLACVGHVVGEADPIDPHELFKVDVPNVGSVCVLETFDEESAIGIRNEECADPTRGMRLHIDGERVGGTLNDRVRVLNELRAACMWEVCFSPGFRVDGNVEDHLAVVTTTQVLEGSHHEFAHDTQSDDSATEACPDTKVDDLPVFPKVVGGSDQPGRLNRVRSIFAFRFPCNTEYEIGWSVMFEVL